MTGTATVPPLLQREMGCTMEEFVRWIPGATRNAPVVSCGEGSTATHTVSVASGSVQISVQAAPSRRIGAIVLPVLLVTFRFIDLDAIQRAEFLAHFDNYTRRGGG
ncbi:MAG: hypothetical protein JWR21_2110 [Herminiimonas sp.]|nr:hypothetical protein [Herminiimonas sp.]MDB5854319.1 hypothetical protein [Herminiimonas sp.]